MSAEELRQENSNLIRTAAQLEEAMADLERSRTDFEHKAHVVGTALRQLQQDVAQADMPVTAQREELGALRNTSLSPCHSCPHEPIEQAPRSTVMLWMILRWEEPSTALLRSFVAIRYQGLIGWLSDGRDHGFSRGGGGGQRRRL